MNSKDKNVVTTFFLVTTAEKVMNIMVKHWIIYGIAKTENKSALKNIGIVWENKNTGSFYIIWILSSK